MQRLRWFLAAAFLTGVFLASASPSAGADMTFQRMSVGECADRSCVSAVGVITRETLSHFQTFANAQRLPEGTTVFLSSGGGDHLISILLGEEFRKRRLNTFVATLDEVTGRVEGADCASACAYAFMGGVRRGAAPPSRIGVHQITLNRQLTTGAAVRNAQMYMGLAASHLEQMGAAPGVLGLALRTTPMSIYWLSRAELRGFNVVTAKADRTSATQPTEAVGLWDGGE